MNIKSENFQITLNLPGMYPWKTKIQGSDADQSR